MPTSDFYVYVYIDPRNLDEFYYGKGTDSRKDAHLKDTAESEKTARIKNIEDDGVRPMIRVIARGLTEQEALLVEKTLLWKLGKYTTNVASGHFAEKFRPHNNLHQELAGFDYRNGIYYYNVGEGHHRNWDDYCKFGFISAGQGARWRDSIKGFRPGDIFAAYLKGAGFVGVGKIKDEARMVRDVLIRAKPLLSLSLKCQNMRDGSDDVDRSEYVCQVEWLAKVPSTDAKWRPKVGLYTTTHVRASLAAQQKTIDFLDNEFKINIKNELEASRRSTSI